jgi:hypothetical protein
MGNKSKILGPSLAIGVAFILFLIAALGFPKGLEYLFGDNMKIEAKLAASQLLVSILGFGGAAAALIFALIQYKRGEQWKRTEFIANEIKDFESDPAIQNALLMIDWGERKLNLFLVSEPKSGDLIKVSREVQWKALLPHPLKRAHPEYQASTPSGAETTDANKGSGRFRPEEAKIRDTYDVFLTRLDRFANYINSGLISSDELEPFLSYWIEALTNNKHPEDDAVWKCTLLTYINFYGYSGVKELLKYYGKDINPDSAIYQALKNSISDKVLAERLYKSVSTK